MILASFEDKSPIEFPKLMRRKDSGSIYIFADRTKATLLHTGQSGLRAGQVICGQINLDFYEDYDVKITLQNTTIN